MPRVLRPGRIRSSGMSHRCIYPCAPRIRMLSLYGNLLFGISCFLIAAFYIINPISSLYTYLALGIAIVLVMLFLCLLLMPLQYLRTHIALSTAAMTLSAALPLFNLLNGLEQIKASSNKVLCIVSMVISGLLALSMILLILNPKMTYNMILTHYVFLH